MDGWGRLGRDTGITIVTQFVTAVIWSYVYVFLPFYVQDVSPYDREKTLVWTGLIVGVSGLTSALTAPFWGALAGRWRPKLLLQVGIVAQGALIAALAATRSLPALLTLRLLIGTIGGLSTIGMVFISATSPPERLTAAMGLFQGGITLGHIAGPLAGAITADLVGFQGAFLLGGSVMAVAYALCQWGLTDVPAFAPPVGAEAVRGRRLATAWLLCFAASLQITFMPSVLPEIVPGLGVPTGQAVRVAGLIVFSYGTAAILGSLAVTRLAGRWGERRTLASAALGGSVLLPCLALAGSVAAFVGVRFLQVALVAGAIPIIFAQVAGASPGRTIGIINTSRFAAFAVGPMLATWFFAKASPLALYLTLGAFTAAVLPGLRRPRAPMPGEPAFPLSPAEKP
ncbi:MAG TPA: MFS transporter [Candidatus Methylomirabilis sp.]|jgi:DHA1 family multidrug resistance protein-like MFS transporter